ncbi:MAG: tautomerase family protein [Rhizobiaceae bacterium]|nr:tautomerase family protein [Rhizobiaceae bacterium]
MPIVRGTLIRGYDADVRRRLAERLTDAVAATIKAPLDAITVVFDEVDDGSYMRGRASRSPGQPLRPAGEIVVEFLRLMEARDLDAARCHLSLDFQMVFPGRTNGTSMTSLEELVAFSAPRYRAVRKTIEAVNESYSGTVTTVFVSGTLKGERPDGTPFADSRFIDRFEVEGETIRRQDVWNDLAITLAPMA